jgi:hypothetical protein
MANLPISRFLTQRLNEFDPAFDVRRGTGFERIFFRPMQFIVQPIRDEAELIRIGQSFRLLLSQEDPDAEFLEESFDSVASNVFVFRRPENFATGVARVLYQNPVTREYPIGGFVTQDGNGNTFENINPYRITANQMASQVFEGLYYLDIPVRATEAGADSRIGIDELVIVLNDDDVVRVTNMTPFSGGIAKETNTELADRSRKSIGIRSLDVPKGFNGVLFENFVDILTEATPIGFGDPEMFRDILYNVHVGGRSDGYIRAVDIAQGSKDFIGVLVDTTRRTPTINNVTVIGTAPADIGTPNIDRIDGAPVVREIKISTQASYTSPIDLTVPVDLSINQYVRIGIDGFFLDVRIAGVNPGATTRTEIVNIINAAFGRNIIQIAGNSVKISSGTFGLDSSVVLSNATIGQSALSIVFGLNVGSAPHSFFGEGPRTYFEGVHYVINDELGRIERVEGPLIVPFQTTGEGFEDSTAFTDPTLNVFALVQPEDIIRIDSGPNEGDHRVLDIIDNNNLTLEEPLLFDDAAIEYRIFRSGIKSGETVEVSFKYNPVSIDIGSLVPLQVSALGDPKNPKVLERGIRPGREAWTIEDTAFLRIINIEEIDPVSGEATGLLLDGEGGFGQGGFGRGGYGVGEGQDYFLKVNSPHERFSIYEDSYIVLRTGLQGGSYRVNYDYVPEVRTIQEFVLSEIERNVSGDLLIKHYLPIYVKGEITYSVDTSDSSVPSNEAVTEGVRQFINSIKNGEQIEYSRIIQFIKNLVDPFGRFNAVVRFFSLEGVLHNMDGTLTFIQGTDRLVIPTNESFGIRITNPQSPRICRWVAEDVVLTRMEE